MKVLSSHVTLYEQLLLSTWLPLMSFFPKRSPLGHPDILSQKLWAFDNLLLDHVGLPLVVILAVHLVIFCAGWA